MQLCYTCKKCRQINEINISVIDRPQIRDAYPSGMSLVCGTCKHQDVIQPNDVKARESKYTGLITILGLIISIVIGGVFLFKYWANDLGRDLYVLAVFAAIISLPPIVANVYVKNERNTVKAFNNYYV